MENQNTTGNCTIEEHMIAIHGPHGAAMTNTQIIENLSCSIPEDRWVNLDDHLIDYTEQKQTILSPVTAVPTPVAKLVSSPHIGQQGGQQTCLKPAPLQPQMTA